MPMQVAKRNASFFLDLIFQRFLSRNSIIQETQKNLHQSR